MFAHKHFLVSHSTLPWSIPPISTTSVARPPADTFSLHPSTISTAHKSSLLRSAFLHASLASSLLFSSFPSLSRASNDPQVTYNIDDWYRFQGDGFALSIPPDFEDIRDPEEDIAGSALYGQRAKPKPFAARFASSDRSEVLSVVIRNASQLKLTFFATKDVTDLGSLKEAASIFVPVGAKLYAARMIRPSDAEPSRTYYYYEFSTRDNYVALEAAASAGQVFVVGATAPKSKWRDDGRKLRLATASFSLP